jgi:hypothetical protein
MVCTRVTRLGGLFTIGIFQKCKKIYATFLPAKNGFGYIWPIFYKLTWSPWYVLHTRYIRYSCKSMLRLVEYKLKSFFSVSSTYIRSCCESSHSWSCLFTLCNCTKGHCTYFICSYVHMFICSYVHMFICSYVHMFICSYVHMFICSYVQMFICSYARFS